MSFCIPDTSYFAAPEFLSLVLHCMSVIETPINLFGAWMIVFHTPPTMSSVKWPILHFHFWCSFMGISLGVLGTPYVLLPELAGFGLGLLTKLGVSTSFQFHAYLTAVGFLIVSLITVYANRYYVLVGGHWSQIWKAIWSISFAFMWLIASTFMIPFTLMVPEQTEAVETIFRRLPCLPSYVYEGPVFVYTLDVTLVISTITILVVIVVLLIGTLILLILIKLVQQALSGSFSKKTLSLQKRFLLALVIHTSIPFVVGLIPICYLEITVPLKYYNQGDSPATATDFKFSFSFQQPLIHSFFVSRIPLYDCNAFDISTIPACNTEYNTLMFREEKTLCEEEKCFEYHSSTEHLKRLFSSQ